MKILQKKTTSILLMIFSLAACDSKNSESVVKFDSKSIASEADNGNLGPLTSLNDACSKEVKALRRRAEVCAIQDEVRALRKPMNIRF